MDRPCILWTGTKPMANGYAQSHGQLVHRRAYEACYGPIPAGLVVDHVCHNEAAARGECAGGSVCQHRRCIEPTHLRAVSRGENLSGSVLTKSGQTHCKNDHPIKGPLADVYIDKKGCRTCMVCKRADMRRRYAEDPEYRQAKLDAARRQSPRKRKA